MLDFINNIIIIPVILISIIALILSIVSYNRKGNPISNLKDGEIIQFNTEFKRYMNGEGRAFMIEYLKKDIQDEQIINSLTKSVLKDTRYSLQFKDKDTWFPNLHLKTIKYSHWNDAPIVQKTSKTISCNTLGESERAADSFYLREWKSEWSDDKPP